MIVGLCASGSATTDGDAEGCHGPHGPGGHGPFLVGLSHWCGAGSLGQNVRFGCAGQGCGAQGGGGSQQLRGWSLHRFAGGVQPANEPSPPAGPAVGVELTSANGPSGVDATACSTSEAVFQSESPRCPTKPATNMW